MLLVGQEQVPQALVARPRAQVDQNPGVGNPGGDLLVERLERLGLHRIDVLLHELAHAF